MPERSSRTSESPRTQRAVFEPSPGLGVPTAVLEKEAMLASPTTHKRGASNSTHGALESESQRRHRSKRLRSWYAHMLLICVAEFSAEAARGLVLPTLFTYSQELGGDIVFVGLLTSLFSVGRFVSALLFGWLSDRMSFRALYNLAGAVSILGNILYILPYTPSIRSKAVLCLSRCVVGFGAGNRSVCRANIAHLTNVNQRLEYFTMFAMVVFLAYALTPGLGGVFGNIDVNVAGDFLQLNRFTAPGYVLVGLNFLTIVFNNAIFDETISREDAPGASPLPPPPSTTALEAKLELGRAPASTTTSSAAATGADKSTTGAEADKITAPAAVASTTAATVDGTVLSERMVMVGAVVFIFLNFNTRGILSVFETVNVPLFLQITNRTSIEDEEAIEATEEAASFYFLVGLLGLLSYAALQVLGRRVSDVSFLLFGFITLFLGNAILVGLCTLLPGSSSGPAPATSPTELFDLFVVAEVLVWSIGCPLTSAVVVSAFSKVLGTRPQGMLMGIFGSSASIARMLMPFLPGVLPSWEVLFTVNMVLCATCVAVLVAYLRRVSASTRRASAAAPPPAEAAAVP